MLGSASTTTAPRFDGLPLLLLVLFACGGDELPAAAAAEGGGKKGETGGESSRRVSKVSEESLESSLRWGGRGKEYDVG